MTRSPEQIQLHPEVTKLVELYKAGQFAQVIQQADEAVTRLNLKPEDSLYSEIVMQKVWGLWRQGGYQQALEIARQDSLKDTTASLELRAYAYSHSKSPERKLRRKSANDEGLLDVIEKLGPDNLAAANAKIIYDLGVKSGEEKILNPEEVKRLVDQFELSDNPAEKIANLLQNAASWTEKHNSADKKSLVEAILWFKKAIEKYDPEFQHRSGDVETLKGTPNAHHIAGLYFRLHLVWEKLGNNADSLGALEASVAAWSIAFAQDPTNKEFEEKYSKNNAKLIELRKKPKT